MKFDIQQFLLKPRFQQVRIVRSYLCDDDNGEEGFVYHMETRFWKPVQPFKYKWMTASSDMTTYENTAVQWATDYIKQCDLGGKFIGVQNYKAPSAFQNNLNAFLVAIRKPFMGPKGDQGIPGFQGPMGMRGPAYDDLECPHCRRYRSETGAYLFMEVMGGGLFQYKCANQKCGKTSAWRAHNGLWVCDKDATNKEVAQ